MGSEPISGGSYSFQYLAQDPKQISIFVFNILDLKLSYVTVFGEKLQKRTLSRLLCICFVQW